MGSSLTWIAIRGLDEDGVLQAVGVRKTGHQTMDMPKNRELVGRALDNGWYLLISGECEDPFLSEKKNLARITAHCEAVVCMLEEHVMFSMSARWKNGRKIWSVSHVGEDGERHIKKSGTPPKSYELHKAAQLAKQAKDNEGVDYVYELPFLLAEEVSGVKIDDEMSLAECKFDVLVLPRWKHWKRKLADPALIVKVIFSPLMLIAFVLSPFVQFFIWLVVGFKKLLPSKK